MSKMRPVLFVALLFAAATREALALQCLRFAATKRCNPNGPRRPNEDKPCHHLVVRGEAGYCLCEGGKKANPVGCQHKVGLWRACVSVRV